MSTGGFHRRVRRRPVARTHRLIKVATLVLFFAMTSVRLGTQALAPQSNEYEVKAAFLFNFAKYVQWPAERFTGDDAPIIVGVVGASPGGSAIEQAMNGKTANGRPLQIRRFPTARAVTSCHILFVSASQSDDLRQILAAAGPSSLTVGETDRFAQMGGIITFTVVGSKVRFDINQTDAKKGGLKISAKLLSLARNVR